MNDKKSPEPDQYTEAETEHRFTAALGRALTTRHKPQRPMKKAKAKKKKPSR